jgi:hypothetical protein
MIKHRANLRTNCLEPGEQCDRRWPPVHIRLDGYIAFSLDIGDLLQQQFDAGEFAGAAPPSIDQGSGRPSPVISPSSRIRRFCAVDHNR